MGEANQSYNEKKKEETIVNHLKYKHFYMSVIEIIKAKGKKKESKCRDRDRTTDP